MKQILHDTLLDVLHASWRTIAPLWPLQQFIAVNPLEGSIDLPFAQAIEKINLFYTNQHHPQLDVINRESIKWFKQIFDEGQAFIRPPFTTHTFYQQWLLYAIHDTALHSNSREKKAWIKALSTNPIEAVAHCCQTLGVEPKEYEQFFTAILTTLPGFAAHCRYKAEWAPNVLPNNSILIEYAAVRMVIITMLWPEAKMLIAPSSTNTPCANFLEPITTAENRYHKKLFSLFKKESTRTAPEDPTVSLVFCLDVRSEPFRRLLEQQNPTYSTLSCAGFFNLPIRIIDTITNKQYNACPVFVQPNHEVTKTTNPQPSTFYKPHLLHHLQKLYFHLKNSVIAPLVLAESIGLLQGLWMALKTAAPLPAARLQQITKKLIGSTGYYTLNIDAIPLEHQLTYAYQLLKSINLTHKLPPLVILCGHQSSTVNNAYASALDCGACGGNKGGDNARIAAQLLNSSPLRALLQEKYSISIDASTQFIAGCHDTTTDVLHLYDIASLKSDKHDLLTTLYRDLTLVQQANTTVRAQSLDSNQTTGTLAITNSADWASVRPEWGLARNAAFIIGPREATRHIDLEGRVFLHSYHADNDPEGTVLSGILAGPVMVAQWINAQYLFSTLEPSLFGSGSKITHNITGKIGVMQGNSSDLMLGLPLQSTHSNATTPYHEPVRLTIIIYGYLTVVLVTIKNNKRFTTLVRNEWIFVMCKDTATKKFYQLSTELTWNETTPT